MKDTNRQSSNIKNIISLSIMFLFPFTHYYGFLYQGFSIQVIKGVYVLMLVGMSIYIGKVWFYKGKRIRYFSLVKFIALSTVFSMLMAYIFWNQDFISSYLSTAGLLGIVYYFYLIKINATKKQIDLLIVTYTIMFAMAWIYGLMKAPVIVFGDPDAIVDDSRGLIRLRIPGIEAVVFFFFLTLNKFSITKKKLFLIFAGGALVLIIVQLTRQVLFWSVVIGVFYLLRYNLKMRVALLVILLILPLLSSNLEFKEGGIADSLLNLTDQQVKKQKGGDDDVRVKAFEFFFLEYSDNIFTNLFGNGVPYPKSEYGKFYVNKVNEQKSFYLSDVGYGMIYVVYGLVGLILFCILFFKILLSKLNRHLFYVKLFFYYIVLVSIASAPFTNMAFLSVALYLLSMDKNGNKNRINSFRSQFQFSPKIKA